MSSNEACDDASKEALRKQIAVRNSYRRALRVIYETIQEAEVEHLEPELCEETNITRHTLSLDDKSDHLPVFFDRYEGTFDDPKDPKDPPPWKYVPNEIRSWESLSLSRFFQRHTDHHWPEQAPGSWASGYAVSFILNGILIHADPGTVKSHPAEFLRRAATGGA